MKVNMARSEMLVLVAVSIGIVGVAGYTFYWLALAAPAPDYVIVVDAQEWERHAALLYEKYYPKVPPVEEWYTIYVPEGVRAQLVVKRDAPWVYQGETVGAHYFVAQKLSGVAGLVPSGYNVSVSAGFFEVAPGQQIKFACGEYCFPAHDYMGFARIVPKTPTIRQFDVYMHQWYISLDPKPILDLAAQKPLRDISIIEAEVGDIVKINLHVTNLMEREFTAMALASRGLLFEYETSVDRPITFQFLANRVGNFDIFCGGIACGTGHELMSARLIVHPLGVLTPVKATPTPPPTPTPRLPPPTEAVSRTFTLSTSDKKDRWAFLIEGQENPTLRVKLEDTIQITYINDGITFHDFTVEEFAVTSDKTFVPAGEKVTFAFKLDKVGVFNYYCSQPGHKELGMIGKLIVEER